MSGVSPETHWVLDPLFECWLLNRYHIGKILGPFERSSDIVRRSKHVGAADCGDDCVLYSHYGTGLGAVVNRVNFYYVLLEYK